MTLNNVFIKLTVVFSITVFSSCKTKHEIVLNDIQGHWYVVEQNVGYLEFSIDSSAMYVCSPKYQKLYSGRIELNNDQFIQFEESNPSEIRLKGQIIGLYNDTLELRYDSTEFCVRLSDHIPLKTSHSGCFVGAQQRQDSLFND